MQPIIKQIDIQSAAVPLKRPFKTALRTVTTAQTLIVKVVTDDGRIGYGEAAPTPVITGDTLASIQDAVKNVIGPKIIGKSLANPDDIKATIDQSMVHNSSPKAALNIAVNDCWRNCMVCRYINYLGVIVIGSRPTIRSVLAQLLI